jgi:hypothetical protein
MDPAIGDGPAGEFRAYLKVYNTLPDFDSILAGKADAIPFPAEPSARYAAAIGLAIRAKSADTVKNTLDWITANAEPEWIQLFLHAKLDTARADNTFGVLAAHLAANPKIKKFLDAYRKLIGNA